MRRMLVLLVVPLMVACGSTAAFGQSSPSPTWGAFEGHNNLQYPVGAHYPKSPIQYFGWQEQPNVADINAAVADGGTGTTSLLELQTCGNPCDSATSVPITSVTAGNYDSYLQKFGTTIKNNGVPVYLTFDHEMNGNWYPWGFTSDTPAQWAAAWNHVVSTVDSTCGSDCKWLFAPNANNAGGASIDFASYWNQVDQANVYGVGFDCYLRTNTATWANQCQGSYNELANDMHGKPFLLETGVVPSNSNADNQLDQIFEGTGGLVWYFNAGQFTLTTTGQNTHGRFLWCVYRGC